jgi:hypothetical protein
MRIWLAYVTHTHVNEDLAGVRYLTHTHTLIRTWLAYVT